MSAEDDFCLAACWVTGNHPTWVATCGLPDGHLGDHFDANANHRWQNDPLNYPAVTEIEEGWVLARQLAETFAKDRTGHSAVPLIQQAVRDFDHTHVVTALATLTGVLARVLGSVYPGGSDALFAILSDPATYEETP